MKGTLAVLLALVLLGGTRFASATPVTLAFVGDVMLDSRPGASIRAGNDPFARVSEQLSHADLAIANLECAVASGGSAVDKIYTFRAEPAVIPVLARHFGAVTLANNHTGDYGPAALVETMTLLEQAHIPFFGAGRDLKSAHRARIIELRGIRIALLGYDEYLPRRFEAGTSWPGVAWSEDESVVSDIRAARPLGADLVIPFMHWGWEYEPEPSARQSALARRMIDAGADAIVGAHPHVTQTAEYYRGKPIVYSLGNFVFDGFDTPLTRTGWILELELEKPGVTRFRTRVVHLDDDGAPIPDPEAASPCGERGVVRTCSGK